MIQAIKNLYKMDNKHVFPRNERVRAFLLEIIQRKDENLVIGGFCNKWNVQISLLFFKKNDIMGK